MTSSKVHARLNNSYQTPSRSVELWKTLEACLRAGARLTLQQNQNRQFIKLGPTLNSNTFALFEFHCFACLGKL
jgi:hypothetical protein